MNGMEQPLISVIVPVYKVEEYFEKREDGSRVLWSFSHFPDGTFLPAAEIAEKVLKDEIGGQPWYKLCHRKCWDGVCFPEGRIYEDLAISFYPFLKTTGKIGFVGAPLYNYRQNPNGTSFGVNP